MHSFGTDAAGAVVGLVAPDECTVDPDRRHSRRAPLRVWARDRPG